MVFNETEEIILVSFMIREYNAIERVIDEHRSMGISKRWWFEVSEWILGMAPRTRIWIRTKAPASESLSSNKNYTTFIKRG
ncbi:hypothetical protein BT96DRAFT_69576 [Gymnopus androsaceus JB14]|uniref:Uncharacterized protein n=1 Tax=Gymnopus androsaceus JB14 TaxID=1447944 RepID=A0A6A4GCW5_9AGAR|nr:hypothetical protein BT96DRAFT_69576 [Gymnopus androsaceus JB14]